MNFIQVNKYFKIGKHFDGKIFIKLYFNFICVHF